MICSFLISPVQKENEMSCRAKGNQSGRAEIPATPTPVIHFTRLAVSTGQNMIITNPVSKMNHCLLLKQLFFWL